MWDSTKQEMSKARIHLPGQLITSGGLRFSRRPQIQARGKRAALPDLALLPRCDKKAGKPIKTAPNDETVEQILKSCHHKSNKCQAPSNKTVFFPARRSKPGISAWKPHLPSSIRIPPAVDAVLLITMAIYPSRRPNEPAA